MPTVSNVGRLRATGYSFHMSDNSINLVKALTVGPCTCVYPMSSCSSGYYSQETGEFVPGKYDPGPKQECLRCRARVALAADGVEYVKEDRPSWAWHLPKTSAATTPYMIGETVVVSGMNVWKSIGLIKGE